MAVSDWGDVDLFPEPSASAIRAVIRNGGVTSLFQPIVELDSGRVVAYEALARGPEGPVHAPRRAGRRTPWTTWAPRS
jgi:protein tyrosine phosphatase (PTP) superfamily phosphohydrolase (DUF442 family)